MPLRENKLKAKLKRGEVIIGTLMFMNFYKI